MRIVKTGLILLIALMFFLTINGIASTIDYPTKPITMYMPYAAGGHTDLSARILASSAEKILGQPIVVVNKPGGGGTLALSLLKNQQPDGYTIGIIPTSAITRTPHILEVEYNSFEDFCFFMKYGLYAVHISVNGDSPYKTLDDIIKAAKEKPGKISYSVPGPLDGGVILMTYIGQKEGVIWNAVPYPGSAEARAALFGKHVDFYVGSGITSHLSQIKNGEIRVLNCCNSVRTPIFPDVPTLIESGYDISINSGIGVGGPKGIPEEIRKKLEEAFLKATEDPDFIELTNRLYMPVVKLNGAEFKDSMEKDYVLLGEILDAMGMKKY